MLDLWQASSSWLEGFLVHYVRKRPKLWITCLSIVSSVARCGSELSDIFSYPSSPQIVPCLSLLGGAPPGNRSLKPDVKVSMPSSGWSLGRFGGSAIGASTLGRPWCRWPSRRQSSTRPWLGHVLASTRSLASLDSGLWVLCSAFLLFNFIFSFCVTCWILYDFIISSLNEKRALHFLKKPHRHYSQLPHFYAWVVTFGNWLRHPLVPVVELQQRGL
jgi:hypothetical protein